LATILIPNRRLNLSQLSEECGISLDQLHCTGASDQSKSPYWPHLINPNPSGVNKSIAKTLVATKNSDTLFELTHTFGVDATGAIADTMAKLDIEMAGVGAAISTYSGRMEQFAEAVKKYQDALLAYRDTKKSSEASKEARRTAKQAARNAFDNMQLKFQKELSVVTASTRARSRRGSPLTSFTRGRNIARSSRSSAKLNVSSATQAHNLVKLSKYSKKLGSGLVAIDFGIRAANVHKSYETEGDWEREMLIESLSFAASTTAGVGVVKAGLYFLAVATPAGWVGLIVAVTIVGTAAVVSTEVNNVVKDNGSAWYDSVMEWISEK